jgi:pimeloyl-ACP methyl ester carboxylesterase
MPDLVPPELIDVDVQGGPLRVARWGPDPSGAVAVIAVHGITASHVSWYAVAGHLQPEIPVIAPDLRGRGGSGALSGPYGMAAHARDVLDVAAALGVERAVIAGHSMGGYVATQAAAADPDRIRAVLLVDGGLPGRADPDADPDEAAEAVLGPALQRLRMTFSSREEYRDFWRPHPAFEGRWSELVEAYVDYDLEEGSGGAWRSRVSEDAVRGDYRDTFANPAATRGLEQLSVPVVFLRAPRGLRNEPPGFYAPEYVAEVAGRLPSMHVEDVPGCNHYMVVLDDACARLVADRARTLVEEVTGAPRTSR